MNANIRLCIEKHYFFNRLFLIDCSFKSSFMSDKIKYIAKVRTNISDILNVRIMQGCMTHI